MAFANAQELLDAQNAGRWKSYGAVHDLASAQAYVDNKLQNVLNHRLDHKNDRPWVIVDFQKLLDPKQTWIGFEFETGFDSKEDYNKFVHFLWRQDHIALDDEGSGKYPIEVAFPPQTLADIEANGHAIERTVQFMLDAKLDVATNPTTYTRRDIGIHAGISTVKSRKAGDTAVYRLDNILLSLNTKQRDDVYGRNKLHWGGCQSHGKYIEVKTFKSVSDLKAIQRYVKTTKQICILLDFLIDNPQVNEIKNAYQFLRGDTDEIKV